MNGSDRIAGSGGHHGPWAIPSVASARSARPSSFSAEGPSYLLWNSVALAESLEKR